MKYTVVLRRSNFLIDLFDDLDSEFYVASPGDDFATLRAAVKSARQEAAEADRGDAYSALNEHGMSQGPYKDFSVSTDNYEVIMVFQGQHEPVFGWQ